MSDFPEASADIFINSNDLTFLLLPTQQNRKQKQILAQYQRKSLQGT